MCGKSGRSEICDCRLTTWTDAGEVLDRSQRLWVGRPALQLGCGSSNRTGSRSSVASLLPQAQLAARVKHRSSARPEWVSVGGCVRGAVEGNRRCHLQSPAHGGMAPQFCCRNRIAAALRPLQPTPVETIRCSHLPVRRHELASDLHGGTINQETVRRPWSLKLVTMTAGIVPYS